MEDMASDYRILIRDLVPGHQQPEGKEYPNFFLSVTGDIVTIEELREPDYWVKNMVSLVNFSEALSALSTSLLIWTTRLDRSYIGIHNRNWVSWSTSETHYSDIEKNSRPQSSCMAQH